jgi:hypothetical protein
MQRHECKKHNYLCINDSLIFFFLCENQGVTHTDPLLFKIYFSQYHTPPDYLIPKTMLIFSYILSAKINISFLINLKLKKIMYFNVSTGDNAIFQEYKVQGI